MKGWWPCFFLLLLFVPSGILLFYYQRNQRRYEASETRSLLDRQPRYIMPGRTGKPMTQEEMEKAKHSEHPGNLNVTVRNAGSGVISSVYVEMGQYKSIPQSLEPGEHFSYLITMYPALKPLRLSYDDAQGQTHDRLVEQVLRMMPQTIEGNFDLFFHVDDTADRVHITCEDEL